MLGVGAGVLNGWLLQEGHSSGCCQYGKTLEKEYQEDIGFIGGELKYVQIRIRSTVAWSTPFGKGVDVRDLLNDWIDAEVRSGVAGWQILRRDQA